MSIPSNFPVVILTGLSGSGKSTALDVFEDLRFFCVDGLPPSMVSRLVTLFTGDNPRGYRGLALGMDLRQADLLEEWGRAQSWFARHGIQPQIVFFEAQPAELLRRYATTRRPHPLESQRLNLEQAVEQERQMLNTLREQAHLVVDTTGFSIHDLRRFLQEKVSLFTGPSTGLRVNLVSFGFKYGLPADADLVMDLRFLPNPHFDAALNPLTGKDPRVADYVLADDPGRGFLERFLGFLQFLLPLYALEGRYRVTLALGCTGGRHRSVAVSEAVFVSLKATDLEVTMEHRHIDLG